MCLVGARNETATQLKELLCLSGLSDAEILDLNREFNFKLDKLGDNVSLNSLINDLTRLILVNAIYFKGNWCHKFDKNLTYKEDFTLKDGTIQQVDMMKLTNKRFMFKINPGGLKALSCQFPYEGQSTAMTIILPHEGISIEEVETELTAECLTQVFQPDRRPTKVHAFIPKFKLEFKSEVNIFKL